MPKNEPRRGLRKEVWGAITAISVAVIGAAVTLATHFWSPTRTPDRPQPSPAPTTEALVGRWEGTANGEAGLSYHVAIEIAPGCTFGERCGEIVVAKGPCRGSLFLQNVQGGDFEFDVRNFVAPSAPECQPGAGEHLQPQHDGTLVYVTSYEPHVRAVLTRQ